MTTFTREQLEEIAAMSSFLMKPAIVCAQIAAFALALLDQNEALRRDKFQLGEERDAEWKRAEKAEAERDEANDERDDAIDRWARRAREAEATCKELLQVQAERDRLRAQLDSILANSDSLESGKLADANAEIARLREELLGARVAWDMCDAVNRGLRAELREAEEAILLLAWDRCEDCGGTGVVWAGPTEDPQQAQCERCWSEGLVPPPSDPFPIGQRMAHPAVRRARERQKDETPK